MKSIAIIIPYFGQWPRWSELFFDSCRCNKDIDFYFFTDCGIPVTAPNLYFEEVSFKDYCNKISNILHIDFHPQKTRKLCDVKPFYGYIHRDLLEKYDFWGYGDCDLVWGDIRAFYSNDLLLQYDVLSTHADRLSGHLTLIRNNQKLTEMPLKHRHWQKILESDVNYAFDEQAFTLMHYPQAKILWKAHKWIFLKWRFKNEWTSYNRFCDFINRLMGLTRKRIIFIERNTTPWDEPWMRNKKWHYKDGHVTDTETNSELIYLHFLTLKNLWSEDYYSISVSNEATISFEGIKPYQHH